MKKILSGIMSIAMAAGLVTPISAKAERIIITQTAVPVITETTTTEVVETTPAEPRVIYRNTLEIEETERRSYGKYNYTLSAKDNGNIHIDIYCTNGGSYSHVLGSIAFNDAMIAPLGEQGYAGDSTFITTCGVKNIVAYNEDNIIYSATSNGSTSMGYLYATYDFYVKEPYLTTNQTIYISENEVTIPFGEPPVDYQTQIENLTAENETLKSQLNSLTDFLNKYGNRAYGDMNGDGFCDARDASILLTYYARQSVGEVITLDQLIEEQKGN